MSDVCVVVTSNLAQSIRKSLQDLGLHDQDRRLQHLKGEQCVAIPVKSKLTDEELADILREKTCHWLQDTEIRITRMCLPSAKKVGVQKPETILHEALKKFVESKGYIWTSELAADVPSHWEVHGDLALIPSTALTSQLWSRLGEDLWLVVANSLSSTRLARKSVVHTDGFRSPQVTLLRGDSGWVEQIDNGIRYTYDITKCMFSSGNITEKLRVATFDCTGEIVVDLYAGIGYFTLPYLVHTGVKHLHACEWNPDAVEALRRNLERNHVQHRCTIHAGDNRQVCPKGIADRVNLGLIPSSREGWPSACAALRPNTGGTLHIHYNVNTKPPAGKQSDKHNSSEPVEQFRREAKCRHSQSDKASCCHGNKVSKQDNKIGDKLEESTMVETSQQHEGDPSTSVIADRVNSPSEQCSPELDSDEHFSTRNAIGNCDKNDKVRDNSNGLSTVITCHSKYDSSKLIQNWKVRESVEDRSKGCTKEIKLLETGVQRQYNDSLTSSAKIGNIIDESGVHTSTGCVDWRASDEKSVESINDQKGSTEHTFSENGCIGVKSKWLPWAQEVASEIKCLLENIHSSKWTTEILHIVHIKSYAPYVDHVVLDLKCIPESPK